MAESEGAPPRRGRARVAWIVALALLAGVARAETKGTCARCGKPVKLSDEGSGFDLKWEGLCAPCLDPRRRADEMAKELKQRIDGLRALVVSLKRLPGLSDDEKEVAASLVLGIEERIERLTGRLDAGAEGAGGLAEAVEVARDLRQQVARSDATTQRIAESLDGIPKRTWGGVQLTMLPVEAAALDDLEYAKPLLGATVSPADWTGDDPPEPDRAGDDLTLRDVRSGLPGMPVARELEVSRRHSANAVSCADALLRSVADIEAAKSAGGSARRHVERAAYLATRGQRELRKAMAAHAGGIRAIYAGCMSVERYATKQDKTTEELLADWLEGVRQNGLPHEYVREFEAKGLDEAFMAKRRAWLLGVDPAEAAQTRQQFVRLVAPLYVAEARGEAKGTAPPPEEDDLWDLLAILLLRTAPAEEPR